MSKKNALQMLQTRKSTSERANHYYTSTKRDLRLDVIVPLERKKEELENKIFDLENFDLETDRNAGRTAMTQAEVQKRFKDLIEARYELTLVSLELEAKEKIFNEYFAADESTDNK